MNTIRGWRVFVLNFHVILQVSISRLFLNGKIYLLQLTEMRRIEMFWDFLIWILTWFDFWDEFYSVYINELSRDKSQSFPLWLNALVTKIRQICINLTFVICVILEILSEIWYICLNYVMNIKNKLVQGNCILWTLNLSNFGASYVMFSHFSNEMFFCQISVLFFV